MSRRAQLFRLSIAASGERFSYYGLRSILTLWVIAPAASGGFGWNVSAGLQLMGNLAAGVYIAPVLGGWVGDRLIGTRRCVWLGGLTLIAGYFLLALVPWTQRALAGQSCGHAFDCLITHSMLANWAPPSVQLAVSLGLIAAGVGLFKPNIMTLVGHLYARADPERERGISVFYAFYNAGIVLCQFIIGTIGERVDWGYGFLVACGAMIPSLLVFVSSGESSGEPGPSSVQIGAQRRVRMAEWSCAERSGAVAIAILAVFSIVFWIGIDQTAGLLNIFASQNTDRQILGREIPATWILAAEPILVILLAPCFGTLWVRLARRGRDPSVARKFLAGLLLMAAGFACMALAAHRAEQSGALVSPLWLVGTYFLFTIGEIFIWVTGIVAVTQLAPRGYAGFSMGVWYLTIAAGGWLAGLVGSLAGSVGMTRVFEIFVALFCGGFGALALLTPCLERQVRRATALNNGLAR